ncbi:MAG TPA: hypothetical protein VHQ43_02675 [Solirubrobacterales bacterium]|jgi:hypothetical protein|nr:hypothetical protein [Solirubrobacterales bacterium]
MTRKLKVLSLVFSAAVALSALSASSAMAATETVASFVAAEYPVTFTGTQDGPNHRLTFPGGLGELTCTSSHFDSVGNYKEATTHVTVTPTYSGCNTVFGMDVDNPTTVTHNGCIYSFTVHEEVAGTMGDEWKGDVDLECPGGIKGIEIHVWDTQPKHANNEATKCTYVVEPQTIKGIVYRNETENGDVTIEGKELLLTAKRLSGNFLECGVGTQTVKYNGNITLDPRNQKEEAIVGKIVAGGP